VLARKYEKALTNRVFKMEDVEDSPNSPYCLTRGATLVAAAR